MKIKIASWNIAGAHPIASLKHLDYSPEDLSYFTERLEEINADIICLQESHTSEDETRSNAQDIANTLNYPHIFNSVASISHIEEGYQLSTAILSKAPFIQTEVNFYPNPIEPLFWLDGRPADTHEKNLQVVRLEEGFSVANNQLLPLRAFGLGYDDGSIGSVLGKGINEVMAQKVSTPVIWCGDFNHQDPLTVFPYLRELNLVEALPDVETRPTPDGTKKRPDHIFYSPEFELLTSGVLPVKADHYLCWAEFNL